METVVVFPDPGQTAKVARALLAIVGPGREPEVETVTRPHRGFRVPRDVGVEYTRRLLAALPTEAASQPAATQPPAPVAGGDTGPYAVYRPGEPVPPPPDVPVKRRPGRPRKVTS